MFTQITTNTSMVGLANLEKILRSYNDRNVWGIRMYLQDLAIDNTSKVAKVLKNKNLETRICF